MTPTDNPAEISRFRERTQLAVAFVGRLMTLFSRHRQPILERGKVLVVDQSPAVLDVARERLRSAGYQVHTRGASLGTSQWVVAQKPDIVLLDVHMPALSGTELAQVIRRTSAEVGIIFHADLDPQSLQRLVSSSGALGAIAKTPDARVFLSSFDRLVDARRIRQKLR